MHKDTYKVKLNNEKYSHKNNTHFVNIILFNYCNITVSVSTVNLYAWLLISITLFIRRVNAIKNTRDSGEKYEYFILAPVSDFPVEAFSRNAGFLSPDYLASVNIVKLTPIFNLKLWNFPTSKAKEVINTPVLSTLRLG